MQVVLGSISTALSSGAPSSTSQSLLPTAGGFGSLLLSSVQQSAQNTEALNKTIEDVSSDFSTMLASLFKPADSIEALVEDKMELAAMAEELLEKGEMPSVQDLAVLLQVDAESLQNSLQNLAKLFNRNEKLTGLLKETIDSMLQETSADLSKGKLPMEELAALITLISENGSLPFKGTDKQLMITVVKAAQLVNYFAEHLPKQEARFQPLQTALRNAAALLNKQTASSSQSSTQQVSLQNIQTREPSTQQASLQTAFANYKNTQGSEESMGSKTGSVKSVSQSVESVHPFLNQLSKTEQFVMSVKTNPRPMNMEQFIEKFTQILGNSNMMKTPNGTKMLIKLYPEQLGSLRIELLQQNGVMTAKILSSTQAVKELLEQNAHQLKHAFNQQNVTVDKLDIASPDTRQHLFDRGAQQQRQQEQKQSNEQSEEQNDSEKLSSFEEALLHAEVEV
ncbi:flagellar hook-length control protein FliK [Domibacillus sp. A3M-37]|uniref:flagellar hook-length control protein FliK n=1 Tax=Domibacillus sp. A3M-37 TaxID=2962037 RepID=UPI0020B6A4BD|nr:flagellar hook-length control protein FliK [Domibacillus sp. A3M-37]MCP3761995.1 flagellar hook-length control protein FliK [Domibacillus sp. A3M-37]